MLCHRLSSAASTRATTWGDSHKVLNGSSKENARSTCHRTVRSTKPAREHAVRYLSSSVTPPMRERSKLVARIHAPSTERARTPCMHRHVSALNTRVPPAPVKCAPMALALIAAMLTPWPYMGLGAHSASPNARYPGTGRSTDSHRLLWFRVEDMRAARC